MVAATGGFTRETCVFHLTRGSAITGRVEGTGCKTETDGAEGGPAQKERE